MLKEVKPDIMKKSINLVMLILSLLVFTNAHAVKICFYDGFMNYEIQAVNVGPKAYDLVGTVDIGLSSPWEVSGYVSLMTGVFYMVWTNPEPDGCTLYVDEVEFFGYSYSAGVMSFLYYQYCVDFPVLGPYYIDMEINPGACPVLRQSEKRINETLLHSENTQAINKPIANQILPGKIDFLFIESNLQIDRTNDMFVFTFNESLISEVVINIYNHSGQQVASILSNSNENTLYWDGKYSNGTYAPNGMYLAVLRSGDETITTKFVK